MLPLDNCLRVLNVEQSVEDSKQIQKELGQLEFEIDFHRLDDLSRLEHILYSSSWHLIISDYIVSDSNAFSILENIKRLGCDSPFVLVSDCIGEECVVDLMKAGVENIVLKNRLERLTQVVRRILSESQIKTREKESTRLAHAALAAKEQMLAIVSHDIKNPLGAIRLDAQMLLRAAGRQDKSVFSEEVKIQVNRILKATDRLKILIGDLLDKNKSESSLTSLIKKSEDPKSLILEVVDSCRPLLSQKEIYLKTSFPNHASIAIIDRNKMFQVLANLLSNAIKFTPYKGIISISLEDFEHELVFICQDSGPGISDQDIDQIFNKYWSADSSGTGLGLYICKTIVEAHGGSIKFSNHSDGGARFVFNLPKYALYEDFEKEDLRKKIFVVDDDEDLREIICWALNKEGYSVRSFRNSHEAIKGLRQGMTPQLILADYTEGMSREEFFEYKMNLPQQAKNCPVVIMSASPEEVEYGLSSSYFNGVILKPLSLEGLLCEVKKHLH